MLPALSTAAERATEGERLVVGVAAVEDDGLRERDPTSKDAIDDARCRRGEVGVEWLPGCERGDVSVGDAGRLCITWDSFVLMVSGDGGSSETGSSADGTKYWVMSCGSELVSVVDDDCGWGAHFGNGARGARGGDGK